MPQERSSEQTVDVTVKEEMAKVILLHMPQDRISGAYRRSPSASNFEGGCRGELDITRTSAATDSRTNRRRAGPP